SAGTLRVNGSVNVNSGPGFTLAGGEVTGGGSFTVSSGVFNFTGGSAGAGPTFQLPGAALAIGPGSTGAANFTLTNATLSGDVAAAQNLTINRTVIAAGSFSNAGTITLNSGALDLSGGTLSNTGTLTF